MSVIEPCPYCGIELSSMQSEWKKIHINGCYASIHPQALQQCPYLDCPYCGEHLGKISYTVGMDHICNCMQSPLSSQETSLFQFSQPEVINPKSNAKISYNHLPHYGKRVPIISLECVPDIDFSNSPSSSQY